MARRAMATEEKQARRVAILQAARELFTAGDGGLPTALPGGRGDGAG